MREIQSARLGTSHATKIIWANQCTVRAANQNLTNIKIQPIQDHSKWQPIKSSFFFSFFLFSFCFLYSKVKSS